MKFSLDSSGKHCTYGAHTTRMSRTSVLAIVFSVIASAAFAYDSDPGYGARGDAPASARGGSRSNGPQYFYKPTMRYYGKDYVVTYRFVQWNEKASRNVGTTFEAGQHGVAPNVMQAAPGQEPRVTYYRSAAPVKAKTSAPSSSITAPIKTTAATASVTKEVPAISSSTAKK